MLVTVRVWHYLYDTVGPAVNANSIISYTMNSALNWKNCWFCVGLWGSTTPTDTISFSHFNLFYTPAVRGRLYCGAGRDSIVKLTIVAIQIVAPGNSARRDKRLIQADTKQWGD